MRLAVLLNGSLHGMERECACAVLAMRNVSETGAPDTYTDLRLLDPPRSWPDGDYTLDAGVLIAAVHHRNRNWTIEEKQPSEEKSRQNRVE